MAGLIGHQSITKGLFAQMLGLERKIKSDTQEAALEAAIAGEEMVKHIIDTTESSLSPGKMDRNWTHNMNDSVDSRVDRRGNTISIRVGWIRNKETYFLLQNDGTDLIQNGRVTTITPMNALMAGHEEMLKTLTRWGIKAL